MSAPDKTMLDYAIDYAREYGWPVFPCDPATKKPLTEHGFKDATTDPEQISAWWHRWPNAMIGIPTGRRTGVVVLDVDVDPDRGIDGRLALQGREMPATMSAQTPRGGIHHYFQYPKDYDISNSAGQLGPGLDVRGEGGYVIVPPSVNAAGGVYRWYISEAVEPEPGWFEQATKPKERPRETYTNGGETERVQAYGDAALARICDEIAFAPIGQRNMLLFKGSARMADLVAGGYSSGGRVRNHLYDAAQSAGLPSIEIDKSLDSAFGRAEPRGPTGDSNRRYRNSENPAPEEREPEEIEPFDTIEASSWHGQNRPVREFLDDRRLFPFGYASSMTGPGAVGKTLVALQASVACCSTGMWLGAPIRKGQVVFYSAEEPLREMHIRLDEICEAENIHLSALKGLHIIDLNLVADASLIEGDNKTGKVRMTSLFYRLEKTIAKIRPVVVFLDNRGLLVTGNENDRTIASMAMRSLQLLAERYQCSIVMLSHPSLTGMNTGTGSSGSTAWFNAGRSTIYMTKPDDADENVRVLENNKANYAKHGTKVSLKWEFGRFTCTDPPPRVGDDIGKLDRAERVFLKLLRWHTNNNLEVSPVGRSPNYAPVVFEGHKGRENLNRKWFKMAMDNLIERRLVEVKTRGKKTSPVRYLIEADYNP